MRATSSWQGGGLRLALGFFPSLSRSANRACDQHGGTHCAGGARGHGMGGVRQGPKSPVPAHSVGRAAHLAPETHHLFRAASSAQGCGQER